MKCAERYGFERADDIWGPFPPFLQFPADYKASFHEFSEDVKYIGLEGLTRGPGVGQWTPHLVLYFNCFEYRRQMVKFVFPPSPASADDTPAISPPASPRLSSNRSDTSGIRRPVAGHCGREGRIGESESVSMAWAVYKAPTWWGSHPSLHGVCVRVTSNMRSSWRLNDLGWKHTYIFTDIHSIMNSVMNTPCIIGRETNKSSLFPIVGHFALGL